MATQASPKKHKRPRPKFDTSPIPLEDLYNNPSMSGLISFLNVPPDSGEDITDLPALRHLKKTVASTETPTKPTAPLQPTVGTEPPLFIPEKCPGGSDNTPQLTTREGTRELPITPTVGLEETENSKTFNTPNTPNHGAVAEYTEPTVGIEPTVGTDGRTGMRGAAPVDRVHIGHLAGGRPIQNLAPLRTAQDGHSSSEQALYRALWDLATQEHPSDKFRYIEIGYERAGKLVGSTDKKIVKRWLAALNDKLSIEIVNRQNSDERIGRRYRVYSYSEIIRRRREAGYTHFQRNRGGVTLVPTSLTIPTVAIVPTVGIVDISSRTTVGTQPTETVPTVAPGTEGTVGTPVKNIGRKPLGTSIPERTPPPDSVVITALREVAGEATDQDARKLVVACRQIRPDAKPREIAHFIRFRGSRANGIGNMNVFLIAKVPEHFKGKAFELYRDEDIRRIREAFERQRRDLEETRRSCTNILESDLADEADRLWATERIAAIHDELQSINADERAALDG